MSDIDDIQLQASQASGEGLRQGKRQEEESNEKGVELPGKRTAAIARGTRMVCSRNQAHPGRWKRREGETCRICGAELVPLASSSHSSGSGGASP